jgi:hypothetical protein
VELRRWLGPPSASRVHVLVHCRHFVPTLLLSSYPPRSLLLQPLGIGLILGALLIILSFTQMKMPGYLRNWGAL